MILATTLKKLKIYNIYNHLKKLMWIWFNIEKKFFFIAIYKRFKIEYNTYIWKIWEDLEEYIIWYSIKNKKKIIKIYMNMNWELDLDFPYYLDI